MCALRQGEGVSLGGLGAVDVAIDYNGRAMKKQEDFKNRALSMLLKELGDIQASRTCRGTDAVALA